jgi:hypothetical protein
VRRYVVAAALASGPKGCQILLTLRRRVRAARRLPSGGSCDHAPARATPSRAAADLPACAKGACGLAGLVYTEARRRQPAAIAAP